MGIFRTSKGRKVFHCHVVPGNDCNLEKLSEDCVNYLHNKVRKEFPGTKEVRPATFDYNCYGFALARSHGFFISSQEFYTDDFERVPLEDPQVGDVAVYYHRDKHNKDKYVEMHVAIVTEVNDSQIVLLQSKWGYAPEVVHGPNEVPQEYGGISVLLRRI